MQMEARSIAMPSNPLPPSYRRIEIAPLDAAFLIVVSLVSISAIASSIYACIPKMQHSLSIKLRYKVPCYQCHYFSRNPYIKCALQPGTVLTEKAVDCQDYRPNCVVERIEE